MKRKYVLLTLSSVCLLFALRPLSSYAFFRLVGFEGQPIKAGLALLTYSALTYYWLRQEQDRQWKMLVGIVILLPVLMAYLPMHIRHFERMQVSIPTTIAHGAGIFLGYITASVTRPIRLGLNIGLVISALWLSTQGYNLWMHKLHFDSYSGSINEKLPNFSLRDEEGSCVDAASLRGKLVILDFWNTGCGVCFQKFPLLQDYHQRYSTKAGIQFYAVNIPLTHDQPQDARKAIRKRKYTFPVLYADERSLATLFKVCVYPTVVVIDSTQRIVYRGNLEGLESLL